MLLLERKRSTRSSTRLTGSHFLDFLEYTRSAMTILAFNLTEKGVLSYLNVTLHHVQLETVVDAISSWEMIGVNRSSLFNKIFQRTHVIHAPLSALAGLT